MQRNPRLESWDLAKPALPERSQLYALPPIGIGTPFVESLTGYVARLATVHAVSVADLVGRVLAGFAPAHSPIISERARCVRAATSGFSPGIHTINGMGKDSTKWLHALEATTCRRDLRFLTLLPFREILPNRGLLFRTVQAWCPQCLTERRQKEGSAYLPLLWNLQLATICVVHSRPLVEICPYCSRSSGPLLAKSRPGYCGHCERWVGIVSRPMAQQPEHGEAVTDYAIGLSRALGELVAAGPELPAGSSKDVLRRNLALCVDRLAGGNRTAFSEAIRCSNGAVGAWLSGRNLPRIDSLLRTCYHLRVSPPQVLRDLPADWRPDCGAIQPSGPRRFRGDEQVMDKARQALLAALNEDPPPSVTTLARRLGYTHVSKLRRIDPERCKQISAHYRKAGSRNRWQLSASRRICEKYEIENALKAGLAQDNPPSVSTIASSLGYLTATSVRQRFPELCRANISKRAENRKRRTEVVEAGLREALNADPAPTLTEVSLHLGFARGSELRKKFPELCDALLARRRSWEAKTRDRTREDIEVFLGQAKTASLDTVCQRFGFSKAHLLKRFPDAYREIAAAYWQRLRARSAVRREVLEREAGQIVSQLIHQGTGPTLERVLPMLSSDSAKDWKLVKAAIKKARRKLGV